MDNPEHSDYNLILNESAQSPFKGLFYFPSRCVHCFCPSLAMYYMHLKWKQTQISRIEEKEKIRETRINTSFSGSLRKYARLLSEESQPSQNINKDVQRRCGTIIRSVLWFKGILWFIVVFLMVSCFLKKGQAIITNKTFSWSYKLQTALLSSNIFFIVNIMIVTCYNNNNIILATHEYFHIAANLKGILAVE